LKISDVIHNSRLYTETVNWTLMKSLCLSQSNGMSDPVQERIHSNVAVAVAAAQLVQPLLQLHGGS